MSISKKVLPVLLAGVLLLAGCAGVGAGPDIAARDTLGPGKGLIYVYRAKATPLWAYDAIISIDGKRVATLANNGCVAIPVTPGPHRLTQRWYAAVLGTEAVEAKVAGTVVEVPDGTASYIRLSVSSAHAYGGVLMKWALQEHPEAALRAQMSRCIRTGLDPEGRT